MMNATAMPMRRPLIGIALTVMLGTWCGVMLPCAVLPLLAGAAVMLLGACVLECALRFVSRRTFARTDFAPGPPAGASVPEPNSGRPGSVSLGKARRGQAPLRIAERFADLFVYLAILLTAWFSVGIRLDNPSCRTLSALMEKPRESVELVGVVCDDPVVLKTGDDRRDVCGLWLRVEGIHRIPQWQRARGRVRATLKLAPKSRRPRYGERWRLAGVLTDNSRFPADQGGTRPAREWIRSRYTFRADASESAFLSDGQGFLLQDWCYRMRHKCAECLARGISHRPDVVGVMRALLLGYRQELSDTVWQDFRTTGTYHILAISGLHVAVVTLFIILVLSALGISRVYWFVFLAPCLVLFALSTGMRPSTIRGTVMVLLFFLGPLVNRKTDVSSAMALAALIIIAVAPFQLFDYGFILSFTVVAGLIVLCPVLLDRVEPLIGPDPLRLEPEPAHVRHGRRVLRVVVFSLVSSLAAWFTATPFIARWFNLVSLTAPLSNLLLVPLVPLILLGGCLSIFFGPWFPLLGEIFNFADVVLVSVMISYVRVMARIPYACLFIESPPLWSVGLWFITLSAWILGKTRVWISGAACLVLAVGVGLVCSMGRVEMDIMNLGGHPVCLVNVPGPNDLLIDAGPRFRAHGLMRKLRGRGVDSLRALVLTRADARHAGGASEILRSMPVRELWCSSTNMRSAVFQSVVSAARELGVAIPTRTQGDSGVLPGGVTWSVLYPDRRNDYESAEQASMVMLFKRRGSSLMFLGELSEGNRPCVMGADPSLRAQVIVEEWTGKDWFERSGDERSLSEGARWRVICVPSRIAGRPSARAQEHENRDVILQPGQGIRVSLSTKGARVAESLTIR